MNGMKKYLAATFLSAAILFSGVAQAMEIRQFDKMAGQDQDNYIADLIVGAQKVLIDEGKDDLATQVEKLFTTTLAGDKTPLGLIEFSQNLDRARLADVKRSAQDPNAKRLEVEDAMAVTLKKNGINLPPAFFTVASNFKPKFPPQSK